MRFNMWEPNKWSKKKGPGLVKFADEFKDSFKNAKGDDRKAFENKWEEMNKNIPFPFNEKGKYTKPDPIQKSDNKDSKDPKYKNKCVGVFVLPGIRWVGGETQPVPKDIRDMKKFKHAVKIGVLKKV